MKIEFTIGLSVIEFLCHFFAAILYMVSGYYMVTNTDNGFFTALMAIGLTVIGASL